MPTHFYMDMELSTIPISELAFMMILSSAVST